MDTEEKTEEQNIESPPHYKDFNVTDENLRNYGLIFLIWGWINALGIIIQYVLDNSYLPILLKKILEAGSVLIMVLGVVYTFYFLWKQKSRPLTYQGLLLRYAWISLIPVLMLVNVILNNELGEVNFDLQHPIFMSIISFAIVFSGAILRDRILISGGIFFAICAFLSSYIDLVDQRVLEAAAWIVALVVPGHLMYAKKSPEKED